MSSQLLAEVKGVHPYADKFPMASDDELAELTESVATVGLIQPITITNDGLVLDGRNRLEACKRAGVEPHFVTRDGDDDDYKEFVIGVNTTGRRESMTVQIAAASSALVLGHEKRINGQWKRGAVKREFSPNDEHSAWRFAIKCSGLVLDVLGPAYLEDVRDGKTSLNAAYEQARREKDRQDNAERERIELAKRQEREEEAAREFFADNNDAGMWLSERPGQHKTLYAAFKQYEAENEEVRLAEERRRREEEAQRRADRERVERMGRYLEAFISNFQTGLDMADHPEREAILSTLAPKKRADFIHIENTYLKGTAS